MKKVNESLEDCFTLALPVLDMKYTCFTLGGIETNMEDSLEMDRQNLWKS